MSRYEAEIPGYDVRNGGNTSRFGPNRVFLFLYRSRCEARWQAHCQMLNLSGNWFGTGDSPREAYANLMCMLSGRPPSWGMSEAQTEALCRLTPTKARHQHVRGQPT